MNLSAKLGFMLAGRKRYPYKGRTCTQRSAHRSSRGHGKETKCITNEAKKRKRYHSTPGADHVAISTLCVQTQTELQSSEKHENEGKRRACMIKRRLPFGKNSKITPAHSPVRYPLSTPHTARTLSLAQRLMRLFPRI